MITDGQRGDQLWHLVERLYPICRSITGNGVRESLDILSEKLPLEIHEVPSGTPVLDWTIPDEWNIRGGWIQTVNGNRIIDFANHNLHVVSYSEPVRRIVSREELLAHLHTLPEHPDWIPYRTSYYQRDWGFCASQRVADTLSDPEYEVCIDATLEPGHLTYGELLIPGTQTEEIVISAHICHPSLANDNVSGIAIATMLAQQWLQSQPRHSIRFLFIPGTIGAIAWLAHHRTRTSHIRCGLTLNCLGDGAPLTYKRTYQGMHSIDRTVQRVLSTEQLPHRVIDYFPYGYDERQFNSPGFRIPFGSLMRSQHGRFPQYHTSADNLDFIAVEHLVDSFRIIDRIIGTIDRQRYMRNRCPYGEPQLGRRGIYRSLALGDDQMQSAMLWILSMSDGTQSLTDISERSGLSQAIIERAADLLQQHDLLGPA